MDQENPESIKEQYKELGRIVYSGYKTADLEQDVSKLTHLTKFQRVILLGCLKRFEDIFDGNLGEWIVPPIYTSLDDEANLYHARAFTIMVIHIEDFKKDLDIIAAIGILTKINCSE